MLLFAIAAGLQGVPELPKRLRLYLSDAWLAWRLQLRREELASARARCGPSLSQQSDAMPAPTIADLDLLEKVESTLEKHYGHLESHFEATTAAKARAANMRTDTQVLDGNQKNRRLVCAALLRHKLTCRRLGRSVFVRCRRAPLLGSIFCREHTQHNTTAITDVDYEVIDHEVPTVVGLAPDQPFAVFGP